MLLSNIISELEYSTDADFEVLSNTEITDIVYDSRKAARGTMFFCLVGAVSDGHDYAESAYKLGARVFCTQRKLPLQNDAIQIIVQNTRAFMALASAAFFGHPARSLMVIGVTGTKGKTTTSSIICDVLNAGGINTACIGTTGIVICGERTPTKNTTPESYELHKAFRKMVERGVSCVVMEVSSQAMFTHRVDGIRFHIGVFTNLSPDHIGGAEHPTFEHYMSCKAALFCQCRYGILNSDDEHCADMMRGSTSANTTFGASKDRRHDIEAQSITIFKNGNVFGTRFTCHSHIGDGDYELRMPGEFNVYNALAAIAVAQRMEIPADTVREALIKAYVKGRFEIVEALPDAVTVIDYAHNAVSMKAALETIKTYEPSRLVVLFGSVGGRTELRRAELGQIASQYADLCIITSDNPDREPPEKIIADIEAAVKKGGCPYVTFVERHDAVKYAIDNARAGDCILFAGKGHEDYQIINGEYVHYDEREEILDAAAVKLSKIGV